MYFNDLSLCICFGDQPTVWPVGMSPEYYIWLQFDDFANNFNECQHAKNITSSKLICFDRSISSWYGQGGEWINHGLPMYAAMDKPENGCKNQNSACR
jgi:hypothetical protein